MQRLGDGVVPRCCQIKVAGDHFHCHVVISSYVLISTRVAEHRDAIEFVRVYHLYISLTL